MVEIRIPGKIPVSMNQQVSASCQLHSLVEISIQIYKFCD